MLRYRKIQTPYHTKVNLQAQKWNIQQISSVKKKSEEIREDNRDEKSIYKSCQQIAFC